MTDYLNTWAAKQYGDGFLHVTKAYRCKVHHIQLGQFVEHSGLSDGCTTLVTAADALLAHQPIGPNLVVLALLVESYLPMLRRDGIR